MAKFKTDNYHDEFDMASRAYTVPKFQLHFDKIKTKDPRITVYLEEIRVERWSRAFFPEWFHDRREKASNHTEHLSQYYEKYLCEQAEKARFYTVNPLNRFEFHVNDGQHDFQVDLQTRTCTCRVFDLSGLPCKHALAVARSRKTIPYEYCSRFITTKAWCMAYVDTCYPVCDEGSWDIPENIKERVCLKPPIKVKKGRPTTKRRPSQGEPRKEQRRCNSCGGRGHNRATCKAVMSAPYTSRQQVSQPSQPSQLAQPSQSSSLPHSLDNISFG
ncbi:uncharacterized protein LOC124942036 [Impatiens glandulifera]|uniref:uncharacterized protein LOC124942036 n=1 Tax=Impatiens glandulifera TaxID=253017 RepID=UPI001FB1242F|nr:uncharacterized protein LOC124942036 [Impatiens glandulifera]